MSATELEAAIGRPDSLNNKGVVFEAATSTKKTVEKWFYPRRTVVLIDDTVTSPNIQPN